MTSSDDNKAAVRGLFASASSGELDRFAEHVTADFVIYAPEPFHGAEGLRDMVAGYRSVLPDLEVTVDHQFADGDYVATRFTVRGTHDGEFMGVAPTGRAITFSGICLSRCRDGKVVEEWELADTMGLMRQIGVLQEPAAA